MTEAGQCPDCGHTVTFIEAPSAGQRVRCSHCASELEVVDAKTLELDWAYRVPAVEDDWQYVNGFGDEEWSRSEEDDGDDD
jgi:lysine biosynthesis protein LysW